MNKRKFCIAPMMKCTDQHYRTLMRILSKQMWLYTEMVTARALLHGNVDYLLRFGAHEQPLALQVGGSEIKPLQNSAKLAEQFGFKEINLNVGCPSDRVQSGNFGACLMREPQLVADCIAAMQDVVDIDVTVKTRVGVDELHSYPYFLEFIDTVAKTGCKTFIIHARKAWLNGLSPKENRNVPPLQYDWVYQLKQDRPELDIIINGGIATLDDSLEQLQQVDGVMVGRAAYSKPFSFAETDTNIYGSNTNPVSDPYAALSQYLPYMEKQLLEGERLYKLIRPILPLFHGCKHAKIWRRFLTENSYQKGAGMDVMDKACGLIA